LRAGPVKTLAIDVVGDNCSFLVKLDFDDADMPSIDFGMAPLDALRLYKLLLQPSEDLWTAVRAADLLGGPADRDALDCDEITLRTYTQSVGWAPKSRPCDFPGAARHAPLEEEPRPTSRRYG
jgi:hypothetical protein